MKHLFKSPQPLNLPEGKEWEKAKNNFGSKRGYLNEEAVKLCTSIG
jgi:hypothetical protein